MLSFQHRNILEKFDYNKKELSEDLDRRTAKFHAAERRYDTADKIRLPIADKIIAAPIRNMLRDAAKSQEQRMNDEWKSVYGAGYPWMKLANGTLEHAQHFLKENTEVLSESKDGWYHIPDAMCQSASERNIRNQLEEECKQMGKQIPYEIGKQLETMFLQAKETHEQLWVHRTGLSIDGGDLASIAQRGLAVPTQGY